MQQLVMVGVGGAVGAIARYAVSGLIQNKLSEDYKTYPFGTLAVNLLGCLLIGVLMTLIVERQYFSENVRLLMITGFLGSLTTFSAFGHETVTLMMQSSFRLAFMNVGVNVVVGCAAVFVGHWVTKSLL